MKFSCWQVENTLYKLCSSILSLASNVFHEMFTAAQHSGQKELDGMNGDRLIHLEGISREGLELLLEHTFGRYVDAIHTVFLTQLFNDL